MKSSNPSSALPEKRTRIFKKLLLGLLAAFVLYVLLGFFAVPPIVRSVGKSQVEKNLHARLEMGDVAFNPLTLRLRLRDISIQDLQGQEVVRLGDGQFAVSLSSSLAKFAPVLKEVLLDEPALFLSRNADGEINVLHLLKETETEKPPSTELPKLAIQRFSLTGGAMALVDNALKHPVFLEISPIAFDLENFSTFESEGNKLRFSAKDASGGSVEGSGSFSVAPMAASVEVALHQFDLSAFAAYVREFLDVDLRQGVVDLHLSAAFNGDSAEEMISGNLDSFAVSNLHLSAAGEPAPFFTLGKVEIANAEFAAWEPRLEVESVRISDGNARVRRLQDGSIDLLQLLPESAEKPSNESAGEGNSANALPLNFVIASIGIDRFEFLVEDLATGEDAQLEGRLEHAEFRDLTEDLGQPIPFNLKGVLLKEGGFSLAGNLTPNPIAGEIDVAVDALPLARFDPWAGMFTDLSLQSGNANLAGKIRLQSGTAALPIVTFNGTAGIQSFEARDGEKPVLAFSLFELDGLELHSEPLSLHSKEIRLAEPQAVVALEKDGNVNLLRLLRVAPSAETAQAPEPAPQEVSPENSSESSAAPFPFTFGVGVIRVENGAFSVSDETVTPIYSTRLEKFNATVVDLTSDPEERASIDVSGEFPGASRLSITGTTNADPTDLFADMTVELASFGLPPVSPYSGKFIGRAVGEGNLTFTVKAKLEDESLSAQNTIRLKNLYLGERVESESAVNLPLDIALALLRDRDGVIAIDIPLSGRLDDPQFNIAAVATDTLFSVIRNVASSPFAALGKLVGAKSENLSEIVFTPGEYTLSDKGQEVLRELATALHQRPALRIEVAAVADPIADRPALLEQHLREELKTHQAAMAAVTPREGDDPLSDADLIRSLYETRFGPLEIPAEPEEQTEIATTESPEPSTVSEETAPAEEIEEEKIAESKPFIVVHVPQWITRLISKRGSAPEIEIAKPSEVAEATEVSIPEAPEEVAEPIVVAEVAPLPTTEEMKAKLLANMDIPETGFQELAQKRIETVRKALLESGQIESERVSAGTAAVDSGTKAKFTLH